MRITLQIYLRHSANVDIKKQMHKKSRVIFKKQQEFHTVYKNNGKKMTEYYSSNKEE
jgi:hypothetical protein